MDTVRRAIGRIVERKEAPNRPFVALWCRMRAKLACEAGQGTTEFAILVGVLVVVAILAIGLFKPRLEQLWQAIAEGINGL